jgi:polyhydroxybutyrate depolymerase
MYVMKRALGWAVMVMLSLSAAHTAAPLRAQSADACAGRPAPAPGLSEQTFEHNGVTRRYLLYAPAALDGATPAAVVFSMHGFASNARQQVQLTGWNDIADAHGFLVVYPQGLGTPPRWNAGSLGRLNPGAADDVGFLSALAAHLSETWCIDPDRVYANGMSNGGGMAYRLACEASDVFAAFGGVAGAYAENLDCAPLRPVPMLFFHGTADPIVPYGGGNGLPAIAPFVHEFAQRNGCDPQPIPLAQVGSVGGWQYLRCDDDAEVALYVIDNGGHTWPGGPAMLEFLLGETTQDIIASAVLWDFYEAHPRQDG